MRLIALCIMFICCSPSAAIDMRYVSGLQPTDNMTLIQDLKQVLAFKYDEPYQAGVFDCCDTCRICKAALEKARYQPMVLMRAVPVNQEGESHLWLAVPDSAGRYAFVETTLPGIVISEDVATFGYDEGYQVEDLPKLLREFGR